MLLHGECKASDDPAQMGTAQCKLSTRTWCQQEPGVLYQLRMLACGVELVELRGVRSRMSLSAMKRGSSCSSFLLGTFALSGATLLLKPERCDVIDWFLPFGRVLRGNNCEHLGVRQNEEAGMWPTYLVAITLIPA